MERCVTAIQLCCGKGMCGSKRFSAERQGKQIGQIVDKNGEKSIIPWNVLEVAYSVV